MNKELLDYFNGDELAASAWYDKYRLEGEITPDAMHQRMAKEFARIEENYNQKEIDNENNITWDSLSHYGKYRKMLSEESIYNLFKDFKYIVPQGSIMSMLGNPKIGSLSNCFVIGQPYDSYGGILQKEEEMVQLMKRRGGVGIDISTLRPAGTNTNNAAKTSTGAASFMERFSHGTREVAQDGRRGALMLTIDVRHPDVLDFINAKKDRTKVTGANISVMLRDDFMEAVKKDEDYILRFPCDLDNEWAKSAALLPKEYNVLDKAGNWFPNSEHKYLADNRDKYFKKVKAKEIYDAIVENAHDNAEPGQMFIDRHWEYSPDAVYPRFKMVTTNPCGEIGMSPYDACRLLAINFFSFIENPFTDKAKINVAKLKAYAYEMQRLADDLVDLELEHINRILLKLHNDPEPDEIKRTEIDLWEKIFDICKAGRRTGCGFTGLGDALAALGVGYDTVAGLGYIETLMKTKAKGELECTVDLAILRGSFEGWNYKVEDNEFYTMVASEFSEDYRRMRQYGRRNVSWSTVAPTGTVSLLTQTTSGMEPLYSWGYFRKKKINSNDENSRVDFVDENGDKWQEYPVLHPKFKEWLKGKLHTEWLLSPGKDKPRTIDELSNETIQFYFEKSPWFKSTANDIDWTKRVDIQALIQKYTSHSISSTINLPKEATKEDVAEIYMHAYKKKLKGVTVYRDGSRDGVLTTEASDNTDFPKQNAPKRPETLPCDIYHITADGERVTFIVGLLKDKPFELFAIDGWKAGGFDKGKIQKLGGGEYNLILQNGVEKVKTNFTEKMSDVHAALSRMTSLGLRHSGDPQFAIDQLDKSDGSVASFTQGAARVLKHYLEEQETGDCPECEDGKLIMTEGCTKCNQCSYSKC